MPTANSPASKEIVTAALLVIGGKILSGRTKDQNISYVAEYLTAVGIDLKEVRVVGDEEGSDCRRTQCAPASLHLCLHHRRDRADPR
jgi:molybdopterin biosynthesis enzyme MoaB